MTITRLIALVCAAMIIVPPRSLARTPDRDAPRVLRGDDARPPASEYYTTDPKASLLVRVNIWGEVSRPGVYYLPLGSSFVDSVSSAGGPLGTASLPEIRLIRGTDEKSLDLFSGAGSGPIKENDMIFVDRSIKAELPLILGTISTILSVAAFYFVMSKNQEQ